MIPDHAWAKEEAQIIKQLWNGEADAHTHRRALQHIVEVLGLINGQALVPGSPDLTAFNEGRRWVARQLQNAVTLPLERLIKEEKNEPVGHRAISATERAERAAAAGKPARAVRTRSSASV